MFSSVSWIFVREFSDPLFLGCVFLFPGYRVSGFVWFSVFRSNNLK